MIDKEELHRLSRIEDDILNLIDHRDDFTRSDLQGVVGALVKQYCGGGTIKITIEGGCLQDVEGLPDGWFYELDDRDNC